MSLINLVEIEKKSKEIYERIKCDINIILIHKALPEVFSNLIVKNVKLSYLSSIVNSTTNTVLIKPFDKENMKIIEDVLKKIQGYSLTVKSNDTFAMEIVPLYDDVKKEQTKKINNLKETGIIKLRQIRQDALNLIKKNKANISENIIKKEEKDLQKIIDDYSKVLKDIIVKF
jgi:ribosome recycling factor